MRAVLCGSVPPRSKRMLLVVHSMKLRRAGPVTVMWVTMEQQDSALHWLAFCIL